MFGFFRPSIPQVTAEELRQRLAAGEGLTILDVREPHEFARGHIPGALLVPLGRLEGSLGELRRRVREGDVVVVCRSGNRSAAACRVLREAGIAAWNLRGGMLAWRGPVRAAEPV